MNSRRCGIGYQSYSRIRDARKRIEASAMMLLAFLGPLEVNAQSGLQVRASHGQYGKVNRLLMSFWFAPKRKEHLHAKASFRCPLSCWFCLRV